MTRPSLQYFRRLAAKAPRGQFWLFFTAALFFNFGFSIFFFLFNLYLLGFHFTERSLGLIGGFMALGSILGTIPVGICAQRLGLRLTLVSGLLCTVVFSVLRICFLAQPAQLALALLTGMTLCSWAVCLSPAIASLTREQERPFAFSLMFSSGIGVAALGALVAGQLPGWLRHLPQSFTAGEASTPHARVCLWRSGSFDRSPTQTEPARSGSAGAAPAPFESLPAPISPGYGGLGPGHRILPALRECVFRPPPGLVPAKDWASFSRSHSWFSFSLCFALPSCSGAQALSKESF